MDSSDGLARSIHILAKESGVGFDLTYLPVAEGVDAFAIANGLDPEKLALEGGEEYEIVGTVKESGISRAEEAVRRAGGRLIRIGKATGREGVVELVSGGKRRRIRNVGWTHLGGR
jgi:thiamine-monophosphate kinase